MTGLRFVHESLAQRVVFGAGEAARRTAEEVDRLGASALRDLGLREADLPGAVEAILPSVPVGNPVQPTLHALF